MEIAKTMHINIFAGLLSLSLINLLPHLHSQKIKRKKDDFYLLNNMNIALKWYKYSEYVL